MASQQREADVTQNDFFVKCQRDPVEDDDRCILPVQHFAKRRRLLASELHQYINVIRIRVRKKSTAITATEAATTAFVVARPTPCVPPLVRRPT